MSALTDWLKDIADAIRAKEDSVDLIPHAAFPSRIDALQTGEAGGDWKPSDWPDIEAIVDADVQSGYTYKYIYLMADDYSYANLSGGSAYKTSDGAFYTSNTQHTWDTAQDFPCSEGYKTRWVIVYTASENQNASLPYEVLWVDSGSVKFDNSGFSGKRRLRGVTGEFQQLTNASSLFYNCYSLTKVPDVLDLSQCTSAISMFGYCYSLTKVPDVLDLSQCTNASNLFNSCHSLTKVPDVLDLSECTNASSLFYNCYSLTKVPDVLDLSQCTTAYSLFNYCYSLTKVPDVLDVSQCTSTSSMFNNCYSLIKVPDVLDVSQCTGVSSMFNNCYSLIKVPDVLDLSQCTSVSYMFGGCYSLLRTPQLIVSPTSAADITFSFPQSTRINADHRASVAAFTGASLTGGMVYHLPTVTNARTLTLNSTIKNLFTAGEQAEIVSHLTGKNWSLSW